MNIFILLKIVVLYIHRVHEQYIAIKILLETQCVKVKYLTLILTNHPIVLFRSLLYTLIKTCQCKGRRRGKVR